MCVCVCVWGGVVHAWVYVTSHSIICDVPNTHTESKALFTRVYSYTKLAPRSQSIFHLKGIVPLWLHVDKICQEHTIHTATSSKGGRFNVQALWSCYKPARLPILTTTLVPVAHEQGTLKPLGPSVFGLRTPQSWRVRTSYPSVLGCSDFLSLGPSVFGLPIPQS